MALFSSLSLHPHRKSLCNLIILQATLLGILKKRGKKEEEKKEPN